MKKHVWTKEDDELLSNAVEECRPLFEHFREQGSSYSEINAWDAVAGRMVKNIIVTGMACKRRYNRIKDKKKDKWKLATEEVDAYERDLAETTFDGVSKVLGNMDVLFEAIVTIQKDIAALKKMWE